MGLGGFGWAEETGRRPDFMDQLLVSRENLKFAHAKCRTALSSRQTLAFWIARLSYGMTGQAGCAMGPFLKHRGPQQAGLAAS